MSELSWKNLKIMIPDLTVTADDLSVQAGEWLSIEAPSGFGKSTLLRGILGLARIQGELRLDGRRLDLLPVEKRNIGVVFQDQLLLPHLNAMDNALFGVRMRRTPLRGDRERMRAWFQELGLEARMEASISEFSGGERQRLALLRALAFDPDLLLLDEPFRGLDPGLMEKVSGVLKRFLSTKPIPVVWITHQNEFEPTQRKRLVGGEQHHDHRHFKYDSR